MYQNPNYEIQSNRERLFVNLEKAVKEALDQIELLNYVSEARKRGSYHILKIGLAFSGKYFKLAYNKKD